MKAKGASFKAISSPPGGQEEEDKSIVAQLHWLPRTEGGWQWEWEWGEATPQAAPKFREKGGWLSSIYYLEVGCNEMKGQDS